jgi:hypothetical protein
MSTLMHDNPWSAPMIHRLWSILVDHAYRRETLTSAVALEALGCRSTKILHLYLHYTELHCAEEGFPRLELIVEDAPRLRPTEVNVDADEFAGLEELRDEVFDFRWFAAKPPSKADMRELRREIRTQEDISRMAAAIARPPQPPAQDEPAPPPVPTSAETTYLSKSV